MGWCADDGSHEGYLVGMVHDDDAGAFNGHAPTRLRELGTGRDHGTGARLDRGLQRCQVRYVRVACSCGWRSPLIWAPRETEWIPCMVTAPEGFEDQCAALWHLHVQTTGRAPDGGCTIGVLLQRARGIACP